MTRMDRGYNPLRAKARSTNLAPRFARGNVDRRFRGRGGGHYKIARRNPPAQSAGLNLFERAFARNAKAISFCGS